MEEELRKIDAIRERTGVSYKEAKAALDGANGDVVQALIHLEERGGWVDRVQGVAGEISGKLAALFQEGNATRIKVKQDGQTVVEIPVTVGAIGVLAAPYLAAAGVVAALATRSTIELERPKKNGPQPPGTEET
ncbi:MAG: DUF4342 domain-containing protein [Firmicutes bacterium]|nr:DUF4342 domain-containing protein [Bacillota bacterium]